jgi:hypothetical protein
MAFSTNSCALRLASPLTYETVSYVEFRRSVKRAMDESRRRSVIELPRMQDQKPEVSTCHWWIVVGLKFSADRCIRVVVGVCLPEVIIFRAAGHGSNQLFDHSLCPGCIAFLGHSGSRIRRGSWSDVKTKDC